MLHFFKLVVILLVSFGYSLSHAESFTEDDRYIVHYNAFNSSMVTPAVAEAHNLVRSGHRGMVNITVQRKRGEGQLPVNVTAFLEGRVKHLSGTEIPLEFTQINEGDVVYYIGDFLIANGQPLTFDVDVKPGAGHAGFHLKFTQTLYVDKPAAEKHSSDKKP
jgi:hypothetical protein